MAASGTQQPVQSQAAVGACAPARFPCDQGRDRRGGAGTWSMAPPRVRRANAHQTASDETSSDRLSHNTQRPCRDSGNRAHVYRYRFSCARASMNSDLCVCVCVTADNRITVRFRLRWRTRTSYNCQPGTYCTLQSVHSNLHTHVKKTIRKDKRRWCMVTSCHALDAALALDNPTKRGELISCTSVTQCPRVPTSRNPRLHR